MTLRCTPGVLANNQDCKHGGSGLNGFLCCASAREAVNNSQFRIVSGKPC